MDNQLTILKNDITALAKRFDCDLIGYAGAERLDGLNVYDILPETKTLITLAFRMPRGVYRGIEEGTTYYQYTMGGVYNLEETVMPYALLRVSALIEDAGYFALPQRLTGLVSSESDETTNPEFDHNAVYYSRKSELSLDFTECAVRCGLGERGLSGKLLTPEFGPYVRLCAILTDAPLPSDPPFDRRLCDACGECVRACPGGALSPDGKLDFWQCAVYYRGACGKRNPFMPPAFDEGVRRYSPEEAKAKLNTLVYYPTGKHGYVSSICGRACDRACYVQLEKKGLLSRKYTSEFRKRPEWEFNY